MSYINELGMIYKDLEKAVGKQLVLEGNNYLMIRVDGRAFHTLTKKFDKPYDEEINKCFLNTLEFVCNHIGGCVLGYHQSDELSFLIGKQNEESETWFGGEVQKLVSVVSSLVTVKFFDEYRKVSDNKKVVEYPTFDCRIFKVNKEQVKGYFDWRIMDSVKNSKTNYALAYFKPKELNGKGSDERVKMLLDKGIDYYKFPNKYRRGSICYKKPVKVSEDLVRNKFRVDMDFESIEEVLNELL